MNDTLAMTTDEIVDYILEKENTAPTVGAVNGTRKNNQLKYNIKESITQ